MDSSLLPRATICVRREEDGLMVTSSLEVSPFSYPRVGDGALFLGLGGFFLTLGPLAPVLYVVAQYK